MLVICTSHKYRGENLQIKLQNRGGIDETWDHQTRNFTLNQTSVAVDKRNKFERVQKKN